MSKVVPGHPGEEQLLRLADGELMPRDSAGVREHLEACWECRADMENIQSAVADCVHYRKAVLQAQLPAPPMPWRNLSAGFAEVDREISSQRRMSWRAWVPALAACVALALVVAPWLRNTPSVQAAELLRRAVVAAEARPAGARKVQVRTKSKHLVRPVAELFASAKYDWANPLSAKAYLDWHSSLSAKTDEVVRDGDAYYEVKTRSSESELTEATLRLRQHDLTPVQGMFKFRGDEWVELTEDTAEPEPRMVARVRANPAVPAPPLQASIADELRVLEALHRIGADLGDPIEIARAGSAVEVKGFAIEGRRREQIEAALHRLPRVNVSFAEEAAPAGLAGPGAALAVKSAASPLQSFLEQKLGGSVAIEQFTNAVFDRDEQILARAHAIQRLAQRFPDPSALTSEDFAAYRAMQRSHAESLMRLERELSGILQPVASGAGAAGDIAGPATAQSLLQAARRLELSLSMLLGAAPIVGEASGLPDRITAEQTALLQITRLYLESMGQ
jgi:hypothetical protein